MTRYYDDDIHEQDWDNVYITNSDSVQVIDQKTLGKEIAKNRMKIQLTQNQLAQTLGITLKEYILYENDSKLPTRNIINKLNRICKCNLYQIIHN